MDVEYTWIQVESCHQFSLLFPMSFIAQCSVRYSSRRGEDWVKIGEVDYCFSTLLENIISWCKIQVINKSIMKKPPGYLLDNPSITDRLTHRRKLTALEIIEI